jgi:trehalose-6-phosphate synthase
VRNVQRERRAQHAYLAIDRTDSIRGFRQRLDALHPFRQGGHAVDLSFSAASCLSKRFSSLVLADA